MNPRLAVKSGGLLLLLLSLQGCQMAGSLSGAAAALSMSAITANPAAGVAIGLAVQAGVDEASKNVTRRLHKDQQEQIAAVVGESPVGQTHPWQVNHVLPIENGAGQVRVLVQTENALATCKTFLFTDTPPGPETQWFHGVACRNPTTRQWQWALAEPAVGRWGNLQ
ncbi:hypothetical protein HNQ50_000126 [Silvimonas terrae]|uniref:Surface antigen domain-containing protein n=1 Tax=Silvimonas terrae TaxID=300266 RepID=A0A840RAD6_9NEIS|nr:hypothetical protein [Silvimonas terrae]MBB5189416.1 hypothetical protein [Silvimonas terrae]